MSRFFRFQRYHLTLTGWLLIVMMTAVGIAAWHSGTNLLYLMSSMLIGFLVVQGLLVWACLVGLDVRRDPPQHIVALQEVAMPVFVRNRKRFMNSYAIRVVDYLGRGKPVGCGYVARVPKNSEVVAYVHAIFPQRGIHSLDRIELITNYPFGLAERASVCRDSDDVLVYPALVDVSQALTDLRIDIGEHESRARGLGTQLYGLKEYTEGESAQRIHWRSSAKAQKLMLMEYEKEERKKATLVLGNLLPDDVTQRTEVLSNFELAVIFTASFAKALIDATYEIQLVTDNGTIPHGSGPGHLYRLLRALATIQVLDTPGRAPRLLNAGERDVYTIAYRPETTIPAGTLGIHIEQWSIANGRFVSKEKP